jgi:hypothetical protein
LPKGIDENQEKIYVRRASLAPDRVKLPGSRTANRCTAIPGSLLAFQEVPEAIDATLCGYIEHDTTDYNTYSHTVIRDLLSMREMLWILARKLDSNDNLFCYIIKKIRLKKSAIVGYTLFKKFVIFKMSHIE